MRRSLALEIMDDPGIPHDVWERFHRQLGSIQRLVGNQRAILEALRRDSQPINRVLDIGCGNGELLHEIRRALRVEVMGIELRPPQRNVFNVPIVEANAISDRLPAADVAVCMTVCHHLAEDEIVALVRNVSRSVRRLVILDLVRHWLPLAMFTAFLSPLFMRIVALDGRQSIRRAYTSAELRAIVERALAGCQAHVTQKVSPLRSRQIIDICWS